LPPVNGITFRQFAVIPTLKRMRDYKNANVDGSFYALNYPEHRATLGLIWDPIDVFKSGLIMSGESKERI
jgi:hypothetical protein